MDGDRSERALARIEAALARIEAAAHRPQVGGEAGLGDLQARHDQLRAVVSQSLGELDALITEAGG